MKEKIGKVLRQNKSIISVVVITAILFVYNTGMLFTGIWEGALYNVKYIFFRNYTCCKVSVQRNGGVGEFIFLKSCISLDITVFVLVRTT